MADLNLSIS